MKQFEASIRDELMSSQNLSQKEAESRASSWRSGAENDKHRKKFARAAAIVNALIENNEYKCSNGAIDLNEFAETMLSRFPTLKAFKKDHNIKI